MAITLLPLDVQTAQRMADDDAVAPIVREVAQMQDALYARTGATAPWIGYLVEDGDKRIVGACSFKGPPVDGMVEIAYFTFPGFEGHGWGGDMATALVDMALGEETVSTITAHTAPEDNPSTKILNRLGFEHVRTLEDPEDGTIWQWVLERG